MVDLVGAVARAVLGGGRAASASATDGQRLATVAWLLRHRAGATSPVEFSFRTGIPVSTSNDVPGWEVTDYLGEVFGLIVRSRGAFPQLGANLKSVFGGELGTMTNLLRDTRLQAIQRLVDDAEARGADAVIAMRFDVTSMGDTAGWTEVCAYGTAVAARRVTRAE